MAEEETKENAAEGSDTPEHDTKMAERADQDVMEIIKETKDTKVSDDKSIPDWVPEKYRNADDPIQAFLDGHKALEDKMGEPKKQENTPDESESEKERTKEDAEKEGELDLNKYYDEFQETGEVSDKSYKDLKKLGFTKEVVDTYIDGYNAQVQAIQKQANDIVGGEENYNELMDWATNSLTETELAAYNDQLKGTDAQWELALRGLNDKYLNSGDSPVERVRGGEKPTHEGVQPYGSQKEVQLAMADKRYKEDPSYRDGVMARLAVSDDALMGVSQNPDYAQHG